VSAGEVYRAAQDARIRPIATLNVVNGRTSSTPSSVSVLMSDQVVSISLQKFGRHEPTEYVLGRLAREAESALRG
jgi:hypothetical protein